MEKQSGGKGRETGGGYLHNFTLALTGCKGRAPISSVQFSWVQLLSRVRLFATTWIAAHQASLSIIKSQGSLNSHPSSWWCHPAISSPVGPFFSCLQSFPAAGSFPMNRLFTSGGQSIGASVSASVLPMNIQGWFPLGWTGLISLLSKRISRVFFSTTVQKHQFFGAQPSLWSSSYICTWLLDKPQLWLYRCKRQATRNFSSLAKWNVTS